MTVWSTLPVYFFRTISATHPPLPSSHATNANHPRLHQRPPTDAFEGRRLPSESPQQPDLELRINGLRSFLDPHTKREARPASQTWRLAPSPNQNKKSRDFSLTNLATEHSLRLVNGQNMNNAWELARMINGRLAALEQGRRFQGDGRSMSNACGFRVTPWAVKDALGLLHEGRQAADITAWRAVEILCPGERCVGSLAHLLCRNGGPDCVTDGSFCDKCGTNIRPEEMTYRCLRGCDRDVCEQCVERFLERA